MNRTFTLNNLYLFVSKIKTNERELAGKVVEWFNYAIGSGSFPFKEATSETGVEVDLTTKFGDVILWKNRQSAEALAYFELKPPFSKKENLKTFRQKANQLNVKYAYTWDFTNLVVYSKDDNFDKPIGTEPTKTISNINEWLRGDKQALIKAYINRICDELNNLLETGKFTNFKPEKIYFVRFIKDTVEKLIPLFEAFVTKELSDKDTRAKVIAYFSKQGYSFKNREEYIKIITRQRVYGLITKIIFYLTVRRYFNDLPDILDSQESDLNKLLKEAFSKAQEKDWQAVFVDDLIEDLGIPKESFSILRYFFSELRAYYFEQLADDVIGELFEKIIEPEQRHDLGQYFTNEYLVDFILGAVVNDKDGFYADPTCGSGTFLIRLYDRLKHINNNRLSHNELLNRIWGIDIGKFPSELSTINLFRQNPKEYENFPRVINEDIFNVHKGKSFRFPPPRAGKNFSKIEKEIPEFNALVGNFPFIRQELIEKVSKGYKKELTQLLANEYLLSYPILFDVKSKIKTVFLDKLKKELKDKQFKQIKVWIDSGDVQLKLSGQADIYAYIFIHTATLLSKKGSFAIITSNSWLDVSYGSVLKQFFLDHFKIKMIVASWAEPWFEDAAVNTIITVMEKEDVPEKRNNNNIKFVKLKKKLNELIPYNDLVLEKQKRWNLIEDMVDLIENSENQKNTKQVNDNISSFENDEMRIRILNQKFINSQLQIENETTKWVKYLRAPDIYFEILNKCSSKLTKLDEIAGIQRGFTTGINDFFFLEEIEHYESSETKLCKNSRGWEGEIESIYLKKVFKSPKESDSIKIDENDLKYLIFICDKSKEELKAEGSINTLNYIEWGETQKTQNSKSWTNVPSVKGRENWFSIGEIQSPIVFPCTYNPVYKVFYNPSDLIIDKVLYAVTPYKTNDTLLILSILNSSIIQLFIESTGFILLGGGGIFFNVYDLQELLFPILTKIDKNSKNRIVEEFKKISKREIKPLNDEIKQKDRIDFDYEILKAIGLKEKRYLTQIYDELIKLVSERTELPKMRKRKKLQTQKSSYDSVRKSVIEDCLEHGVKKFPQDFIISDAKIEYEEHPTNGSTLKIKSFFNEYHLHDSKNKVIIELDSSSKAEYAAILSGITESYILKIPRDEKIADLIVTSYISYVKDLKSAFLKDANMKLHDWALAEKMVAEIMKENGIVEL